MAYIIVKHEQQTPVDLLPCCLVDVSFCACCRLYICFVRSPCSCVSLFAVFRSSIWGVCT